MTVPASNSSPQQRISPSVVPPFEVVIHAPSDAGANSARSLDFPATNVPRYLELMPLAAADEPGPPTQTMDGMPQASFDSLLRESHTPLFGEIARLLPPAARLNFMLAIPQAAPALDTMRDTRPYADALRVISTLHPRVEQLHQQLGRLDRFQHILEASVGRVCPISVFAGLMTAVAYALPRNESSEADETWETLLNCALGVESAGLVFSALGCFSYAVAARVESRVASQIRQHDDAYSVFGRSPP